MAACRRCNSRKENHLPHDIGLRLRRPPYGPPTASASRWAGSNPAGSRTWPDPRLAHLSAVSPSKACVSVAHWFQSSQPRLLSAALLSVQPLDWVGARVA